MQHTIITISREYASGGRLIAQKLAQKLEIPFYDKEIIAMTARKSGLSERFIQQAEHHVTGSFLYNLYFNTQSLPLSDQVFIAESNIIREVAAKGPCVIVGRCADYVLRDNPDCLHVFIHAPIEARMLRAQTEYSVKADDLRGYVLKQDKSRANYYNYFTGGKWGVCQNYELVVSSALGAQTVVDMIALACERREARV